MSRPKESRLTGRTYILCQFPAGMGWGRRVVDVLDEGWMDAAAVHCKI